jgi:N-acyl-phosphatidylethanolamine-hydrolysing phospholipase D
MSSRLPLSARIPRRLLRGSQTQRRYQSINKPPGFWQKPQFSTTVKMSSIGGASIGVGLYAAVSNPAQVAAKPEEADEKRHHLKNGKGFTNPWDSYVESSFVDLVVKGIFW